MPCYYLSSHCESPFRGGGGGEIDANFLTNTLLFHILPMFSTCGKGSG